MKLFLRDFDAEALAVDGAATPHASAALPQAPRGPTPEELGRLLIDTRENALAEGREEGALSARAEAEASQTARIAATLESVRDQLAQVLAQDAARRRALERDVVDMLVDIGEQIAPEFLAAYSTDLTRARIRDGLRLAGGSPYLNIRVSPGLEQAIAADLAGLAQEGEAQPRLRADPALHDGEARLDWESGGLDYSLDRACAAVLSALREAAAKLNDDQGKVG